MILKVRTFLLGILISSNLSAFAQVKGDTTQAHKYYIIADSLLTHADYDSSIFYFKKAADLYGNAEAWQKHINCYNNISENHWRASRFDHATKLAEQALDLSVDKLGKDNLEEALAYHHLAIVNLYKGISKKTINYETKSLIIRKKIHGHEHLAIANSYGILAGVYQSNSEYGLSLKYLDSALTIKKSVLSDNHITVATTLGNFGKVYLRMGNYAQALTFFSTELKIRTKKLSELHPSISITYYYIGLIYFHMGEYNLALAHTNKSLEIRRVRDELEHDFTAYIYTTIGAIYHDQGNFELSKIYQRKAIKIGGQILGKDHINIAGFYINLGRSYFHERNYDSALYYGSKALKIVQLFDNKYSQAEALNDIGLVYQKTNKLNEAIKKFNGVKSIYNQIHGAKHPDIARTYNNIANTYFAQEQYQKACNNYQKAIKANILDNNVDDIYTIPKLGNYMDANHLLRSLLGKAKCFEQMTFDNDRLKNLIAAIDHYKLSDKLIDKTRQSRQDYQDKIDFIKTASEVYEGAIRIALLLHQETSDSKYLHQAFYFAEKSKSGVLKDALSKLSAKSFGSIPDSLFQAERDTRSDLTFYNTQIQLEKAKKAGPDSTKVVTWEKNVFDLKQRSDSLVKLLERDYPKYYDLKYKNKTITVDQVQEAIDEKSVFLEYFIGDSAAYAFVITKDKYEVITLSNANDSLADVSTFRASLEKINNNATERKHINERSFAIYQKYLAPALNKLDLDIAKLVVVPDGTLSYLPLDILLTENVGGSSMNPGELPYLIHKYQIQYGYSATLLFDDFEQEKISKKGGLMAFAPSYDAEETDSVSNVRLGDFRDQVTSLKWNTPEVENIGKLMNGETFIGKAAVERTFKEKVPSSNIIHLAMHALVDDKDPMKSRLVFTQEKDSLEDNFLHAYELYNMELPADLTVLSACETGFGKLAKGEGVMSLARAFSYAGCPSVVMSHWAVNDAVTAKLMKSFYQYLVDGFHKDEALRKAKLDFLQNADALEASPYFWGSFVVTGDVSPIDIKKEWSWWYYLVGVVLVFIVLIYLVKRYQGKEQ